MGKAYLPSHVIGKRMLHRHLCQRKVVEQEPGSARYASAGCIVGLGHLVRRVKGQCNQETMSAKDQGGSTESQCSQVKSVQSSRVRTKWQYLLRVIFRLDKPFGIDVRVSAQHYNRISP